MYLCARFSTMKSKIIHKGHENIQHILCLHTTHTSRYYWRQPRLCLGCCRGLSYWSTYRPNLKYPCWAGKDPRRSKDIFCITLFSLTMCERRPVHYCQTQCCDVEVSSCTGRPAFYFANNEYEANKLKNKPTSTLLQNPFSSYKWRGDWKRNHRRT